MKQALALLTLTALLAAGCAFKKNTEVTGNPGHGYTTNTTWTVNTNILALDCAAAQVATAIAVNTTINATHNDAGVISALKNAQVALGGILNGTNPQTTQTVIELLKAQGNPALTQQVTMLIESLSAAEQQLLMKYGASTGGQVAIAMTQAVYSGLTVGLSGH